ncbi:hypothetical protein ACFC00_31505, partial [Streptomyces adustus]|uniref:hypothetical protein n=1 Tax=Streptomyces adustus TaxID=1609272 RepID=UPI0035DBCA56
RCDLEEACPWGVLIGWSSGIDLLAPTNIVPEELPPVRVCTDFPGPGKTFVKLVCATVRR